MDGNNGFAPSDSRAVYPVLQNGDETVEGHASSSSYSLKLGTYYCPLFPPRIRSDISHVTSPTRVLAFGYDKHTNR